VTEYNDGWKLSTSEVSNDNPTHWRKFAFTVPEDAPEEEVYLSVEHYYTRMFSKGCNGDSTMGALRLYSDEGLVAAINVPALDTKSDGKFIKALLTPGTTYTAYYRTSWSSSTTIKDYTLTLYAPY